MNADGVNQVRAETFGVNQPTHKASAALEVTVDRTKATVTRTTPAANATGVARGANITIRFSEAISRTSMTGTSVILKKASGAAGLALTLTYDATTRTLTANPEVAELRLAPHTAYRISLTRGVRDIAGNSLVATAWRVHTR